MPSRRLHGGWTGLVLVYMALVAAHAPLLRLPYYWDEAGYFIPAALDFMRHGWLVPHTTLANGHPPLVAMGLALCWRVAGFHPWVTRMAMAAWGAALVWGVFRLAESRMTSAAAASAAALVAVSPLVFAQSTLAQLDVAAGALVIWTLVWRIRGRLPAAALCLAGACLCKETAAAAVLALLALDAGARAWRRAAITAAALAPLGLWFFYYHAVTGYWLGNPQYLAYNVAAAASPARIAFSLGHRVWQLVGYDGVWMLSLLALLGARAGQRNRPTSEPHAHGTNLARRELWGVVAVYVVLHALVGGAVLARYMIPALALVFVEWTAAVWRLPRPAWVALGCGAFLVANWFWNPPYPFPYEDNLAYAGFVRLHQAAAHRLETMAPDQPIWTAWPATDELRNPDLGYVSHPLEVRGLDDFTATALARAQQGRPAVLYLYSREYAPGDDLTLRLPLWRSLTDRIYAHAPQLTEAAWRDATGLRLAWHADAHGQWVAVWLRAPAAVIRSGALRPDQGAQP